MIRTPKTGWIDSEPDTARTYLGIMNNPADPDFKFADEWAVLEIDDATAPEVSADAICDQTIAAGPQVGLHPAHEGGGEAKQTQAGKPPIVNIGPFIVRRGRGRRGRKTRWLMNIVSTLWLILWISTGMCAIDALRRLVKRC